MTTQETAAYLIALDVDATSFGMAGDVRETLPLVESADIGIQEDNDVYGEMTIKDFVEMAAFGIQENNVA